MMEEVVHAISYTILACIAENPLTQEAAAAAMQDLASCQSNLQLFILQTTS